MTTTKLLAIAGIFCAGLAQASTLPWQPAQGSWPWQGSLTTTAIEIERPATPGSLFQAIDWYHPVNNLNAGSAIEQLPNYEGLIWWDFAGGHNIMDSSGCWHVNGALPIRLTYVEILFGWPGPTHESWWEIPSADSLLGLAQIEGDPTIGGWVTHVNLFVRSVPETGSAAALLGLGLLGLMGFRSLSLKPRCKCGKPCQYYGAYAGYSKSCRTCNEANALRQRISRRAKGKA